MVTAGDEVSTALVNVITALKVVALLKMAALLDNLVTTLVEAVVAQVMVVTALV